MKYIILILTFSVGCFAQSYVYQKEIGEFQEATAFSFSEPGYFFVTDAGNSEIIKIDTLGNVIVTNGGYGWDAQSFDYPADVYSWTLRVFVADKNNDRIQILDKDLNFIAQFKPQESETQPHIFAYPTCVATSNQGDYYILDSDNSRILKYDINGAFLLEIGANQSGNFALSAPKKFAISPNGNLFVIDDEGLSSFDQYGMKLASLKPEIEPDNINITFNFAALNNEKQIKIFNLSSLNETYKLFENLTDDDIIEAVVLKNKLYVLTPEKIIVFLIEKPSRR